MLALKPTLENDFKTNFEGTSKSNNFSHLNNAGKFKFFNNIKEQRVQSLRDAPPQVNALIMNLTSTTTFSS